METMRAIRKRESAPGLSLEEVPVPTPRPDEVLVQIEAASICGTDLHIQRWDQWSSERVEPPLTLGHELCGTVVATGSAVREIAEGDYVSAESHVTCGVCFHCRTGKAHMCEQTQILGVDRDGGFADYVAVPESVVWRNDRTKLPPEIACLQEPFGNAVFATSTQDLAGRAVAVLGCGPVGLFTIAIAKAFGAGRLFASDHVPFRMELARKLGADAVADVAEIEDVPAWFVKENEGVGVGVVFEMSGSLRAIEDAFGIVRHGGNVVLFGIPARPATIDIAESLIFKNLTVTAVNGREIWETWYTTRWLLEHGVVDLRPLITAELPLERYEEAFGLLESGEACKIVLRPNGAIRMTATLRPAARRRARRPPRGAHVQALPQPAVAAGPRGRDGGARRGHRALVEQLPRPRGTSGGRPGRHRRPRAVRRGDRVGSLHLRDVRAAPRPRARSRRPFRHGGCAHVRVVLERERGVHPEPHGRDDGDPHGRAQPREPHRRDPALPSCLEGHLPALGHGRASGRPRRRPARGAQADRHRRRLLDGGRPREAARDRGAGARSTTPS